jgi:hypothetical protein
MLKWKILALVGLSFGVAGVGWGSRSSRRLSGSTSCASNGNYSAIKIVP